MKEGIYIIRLKHPALGYQAGTIIYIGKGDNVLDRLDVELGKKSGHGTFFRSIGLLLHEEVLPQSGKPKTGYNFMFRHPQNIIRWLDENTSHEVTFCDHRIEEKPLIHLHRPPLNIQFNANYCHPDLRIMRKEAHALAAK